MAHEVSVQLPSADLPSDSVFVSLGPFMDEQASPKETTQEMGRLFPTLWGFETLLSENPGNPETFPPGHQESETIDDIASVVHFRFVEPSKINSFPLSGPAGSLVCQ